MLDGALVGHAMCIGTIKEKFKGYRVVVIDPVYDGKVLSAGRVAAVLDEGESSIFEKRANSQILDLREGGEDDAA